MKITFKTLFTFGLLFAIIGNAQATEIMKTSATGTTFKFTATLDAPLITGNKVKIDFGKGGLKAMTCSAKTCTLSSNALPSGISTATYKIGIYNASNVLQGEIANANYVISSTAAITPTSTSTITKTGYTKIANDGSTLPNSAVLGTAPTDWACTKDNKTGLIWEVKTTDGGLRDKDKTYTNYTADYPKCDDSIWGINGFCNAGGYTSRYGDSTNTDGFVTAVNSQSLCGKKDWRLPTVDELLGIVKFGATNPSIDTTYFPEIKDNYWFWSSSSSHSFTAWSVGFDYGGSGDYLKDGFGKYGNGYSVRLVR
ncbi:MAG: DUF1566 domain-containing protein [Methylococcaceae bacterium]